MAQRVEQVTEENSRLHLELRKNLEVQIHAATQPGSKSRSGRADVEDMLRTLQQQLDTLTKDRDTYQELLKKTSHELELLQKTDQVNWREVWAEPLLLTTPTFCSWAEHVCLHVGGGMYMYEIRL